MEGSMKGRVFNANDPASLPSWLRKKPQMQREREAVALTTRYKVVKKCDACKEDLIAEELVAHRLNHENGVVRAVVGTVLQQSAENQARVREVLQELLGKK